MATVIRKINAEKFMNILSEGASNIAEACSLVDGDDGEKSVVLSLSEDDELVCVFAFGEDLVSAVIPLDAEISLEQVNKYNQDSVFVTAVVDEDNDLVLRSVLSTACGVTTENIVMFVKLMIESLDSFNEMMG